MPAFTSARLTSAEEAMKVVDEARSKIDDESSATSIRAPL
jgi:hypothetical protein